MELEIPLLTENNIETDPFYTQDYDHRGGGRLMTEMTPHRMEDDVLFD